ncbi:MAG: J domain-containing protein [Halorubrum sp.]
MAVEGTTIVPPWVLGGAALGIVASVVVALVFYVGSRLSPTPDRGHADGSTAEDGRRHAEIRAYLTAIGERFHENHAVGGVTVPFYLPEREVAVTFDAHDYFRLDGEGVYTILCEHEMPGRGLGRRLPFDVSEPDWGPDPSRGGRHDAVDAAFAELGLSTDADANEVKRAYRERVKQTHPDHGGDEAAFKRLQEAYATASEHVDADEVETQEARGRRPSTSAGVRR